MPNDINFGKPYDLKLRPAKTQAASVATFYDGKKAKE